MLMTRPRISFGALSCTSDESIANTITMHARAAEEQDGVEPEDARQREEHDKTPKTTCSVSSVRPMCLNLPSHATTSAPVTAPAPANDIRSRVLRDAAVKDVLREERQEGQQRPAEKRRAEAEHGEADQRRMRARVHRSRSCSS